MTAIRILRFGRTLLFVAMLGSWAAAQQPIPPDIAARDRALAEQINRNRTQTQHIEAREQMQRVANDQLQRFYYEPWLEGSPDRPGDLVFLPPLPPALATAISDQPITPYPTALLNVVGEVFFMPFGSSLVGNRLNPRQLVKMDRYRDERDHLVGALRAQLASLGQTSPDQRARALAEFATTQANALRKLEADAESIRDELSYLDDGGAFIKQRDALEPEKASHLRVYYATLLAAHFQPGLSLDQRQLLQATAHEVADSSDPTSAPSHVFWLPATARIRWPQANPPGLGEQLQWFQALRQKLVSELTQSIVQLPEDMSRGRLRKHFATMASRQAPLFDELHRLAEEIRTGLANVPYPDSPAPSGLPAELVRLIGEAAFRHRAFQTETKRLLQEFNQSFAPEKLRLVFPNEEPVIEVVTSNEPPAKIKGNRAKKLDQLRKCNEWLGRRHRERAAATEKSNAILKSYYENLTPASAIGLENLADQLAETYIKLEIWSRFGEYYTAVLQPGLSPAQRRLLFNAALRDLEKHRLQSLD